MEEKHLFLSYFPPTKKILTPSTIPPSNPPLHNFTLPDDLRWGNQRFLKCMKEVDFPIKNKPRTNKRRCNGSERYNFGNRRSGFCGGGVGFEKDNVFGGYCLNDEIGINEVREKVILDLQTAADKMKDLILKRGRERERESFEDDVRKAPSVNLRTRRAMNRPVGGGERGVGVEGGGGKNLRVDVIKNNVVDVLRSSTSRLRSEGVATGEGSLRGEKKGREKFSMGLSRGEIEKDFMAMVGHKPARRPKKRAKCIQKQLDTLFPGLGLTEITADMYKVSETR